MRRPTASTPGALEVKLLQSTMRRNQASAAGRWRVAAALRSAARGVGIVGGDSLKFFIGAAGEVGPDSQWSDAAARVFENCKGAAGSADAWRTVATS